MASIGRRVRDPLVLASRKKQAAAFPWLLFVAAWLLLFLVQNEIDAPAHPGAEQSSEELAQAAKEGNTNSRIGIITLGVMGAVLLKRNRARVRLAQPIFTILLLFLAWSALSVLWADDTALTGRRLISLALMMLFAAGCAARMNADGLTIFLAAVPSLGVIPGAIAESYYGVFQPFSSHRFAGTSPHPNVEAANLSVACILLGWIAWRGRGIARLSSAAALLIVSVFLLMTGSRTSMIGAFAALLFSVVLIVIRDHRRLLPILIAATCLLLGIGGLVELGLSGSGEDLAAQAIQRPGDANDASTLNGRLDLWTQCLKFAAEHPILGYGYGGFWSPKRIEAISAFQTWPIQQSHSSYIEELLVLGIPGIVMYVALLFGGFWMCVALFLRGHGGYGAWAAVLLFIAIHNGTEAINVKGQYTNMAFNMIVVYLSIVRPPAYSSDESLMSSLGVRQGES